MTPSRAIRSSSHVWDQGPQNAAQATDIRKATCEDRGRCNGENMNTNALLLQRYRGLYDTGLPTPHLQALGRRFDFIQAPSVDELIRFKKEELVIRDEESFRRFIAHIPDKVMDFVPTPPPSNDPLLQRPKIDFDKLMVLVITSHEPNCFIDLDIVAVELTSKAMEVLCRYSEPGPVVPKVISYGAYCAVVTRRFDGEVVFVPYPEKLNQSDLGQ